MTERKHLKSKVRARMAKTGERYSTARAHIVGEVPADATPSAGARSLTADPAVAGDAGTAAVAALLDHLGATVPLPLTHVIGGGVGLGVFQFHYAKAGESSFFLAGRHRWDDELAYIRAGLERLGIRVVVEETGSTRTAEAQLVAALAAGGPVVAWVDLVELGTRALPMTASGGGYHVVVVRSVDQDRRVARIEDLAAVPFDVPFDVLVRARARIRKQRNRLLRLAPGAVAPSDGAIAAAARAGLTAMIEAFDAPRSRQFSLAALEDWAGHMRRPGLDVRDGWPTVFPPGARLWEALAGIQDRIVHHVGGGLARRAFAAGLRDVADRSSALAARSDRLDGPALSRLAERYEALADDWSALARAALPSGVPAFDRTTALHARRAARFAAAGPAAIDDLREVATALEAVRAEVEDRFPLDGPTTTALLAGLAERVVAIHAAEVAALADLRAVLR